ncbi:hypothetical protein [Polaribacter sp. KT 15]|uniref:hypothetical protein n=1 Tax=Polaribacter sp. KT 15 TaxID=1896175 RepID=UPI00090ABD34|nr:hypothetical protein [Polaribacter sp. KT 15]SHN02155.1 hypothetical protein SAMN05720268_2161 [Polaribacter sp. KT 15]
MKKLLLLFVLSIAFNSVAQESVLLRANYKKGDTYLVNLDQSQSMGAQGGVDMKMTMSMEVTEASNEKITTSSNIKSINMNMLQGGNVMTYDSSTKEEDLDEMGKMMSQQFKPMMQAKIISTLTSRGEILETKVDPSNPMMDQFTKQAKGVTYPVEKVSVGSSWEDEVNEQGMSVKTVYKVSKIAAGKVYIDVSGTVSGMGTGDVKGNLIVNADSGVQETLNLIMNMNAGGMEMEITTKSTTTKQ